MADPGAALPEGEQEAEAEVEDQVPAEEIGHSDRFKLFMRCYWPTFVVIIAPIICGLVFFISSDNKKDVRCLYVALLMFTWWILIPVPLQITSMIPIVLLPVLGITKAQDSCMEYLREAAFIYLSTYLMAVIVRLSGLYVRLALNWMLLIGCSHYRLTFGLFSVTAFGSMWISSTMAADITVNLLVSILQSLEEEGVLRYTRRKDPNDELSALVPSKTATCYLLGAAYSANIGGTATVIGSCVNLAARNFILIFHPADSFYIEFQRWFAVCIVPAILEIVIVWLWMNSCFMGLCWKSGCDPEIKTQLTEGKESRKEAEGKIRDVIKRHYEKLGPIKWYEIVVCILLVTFVLLCIFRDPIFFPGWEEGLRKVFPAVKNKTIEKIRIKDASAAVVITFLINVLPLTLDFTHFFSFDDETRPKSRGPPLILWKPISRIFTWNVFFVIGGGFSIFRAMRDSNLLSRLDFDAFKHLNHAVLLVVACVVTTVFTQFTDSVVVFFMFAPVFAELCRHADVKDYHVIVAIAVCCSFGFMLPWRTPPNSIVHEKAKIPIKDMLIAGIVPTVVALCLTVATFLSLGKLILEG